MSGLLEGGYGLTLDESLAVGIGLRPSAATGARVDRAVLRQAGRMSAVAWRLYVAFCFA